MKLKRLFLITLMMTTTVTLAKRVQSMAKGLDEHGYPFKCGEKPNCVSTSDTRSEFSMKPFHLVDGTTISEISDSLKKGSSRVEIKTQTNNYLHLVYTTKIFRFKDDVEMTIKDRKILFRSASRTGYSDLGKNRSRLKDIESRLRKANLIE